MGELPSDPFLPDDPRIRESSLFKYFEEGSSSQSLSQISRRNQPWSKHSTRLIAETWSLSPCMSRPSKSSRP